jgi:hypothetical protein
MQIEPVNLRDRIDLVRLRFDTRLAEAFVRRSDPNLGVTPFLECLTMRQRRHSMKTNDKHEAVSRIAGRGLVLVGLLAMVLSTTITSRAQSGATPVAAPAAKAGQAPAKASLPTAVKPSAKGQHEGIKVHGYWRIDVLDPDGKLVSHTEFENALTQGDPNGLSGDFFLANLLTGNFLLFQPALGTEVVTIGVTTLQIGINTAGLSPPSSSGGLNTVNFLTTPTGPCGGQGCLVPTTVALNPTKNQVTLSSSFPSTSSTTSTIAQVGTFVNLNTVQILGGSVSTTSGGTAYSFTSQTLNASSSCTNPATPPCAVQVQPGQTVSATVTLSFQ